MTEPSKAIGVRIPSDVWEKLKEYGLETYPSDKSKEGIDVTQSIVSLLQQALGISLDLNIHQSNITLDERITDIVRQQLAKASNNVNNQLDLSLDKRITELEKRLRETEELASSQMEELEQLKKPLLAA
jgi:flagellar capping protein FliD